MILLVITMAFHTYVAALVAKAQKKPLTLMTDKSQLFARVFHWNVPRSPYTMEGQGSRIYVPHGAAAAQMNVQNEERGSEPDLSGPEKVNLAGKIIFVLLVLAFNGVFWYIAIVEYMRPSTDYLRDDI